MLVPGTIWSLTIDSPEQAAAFMGATFVGVLVAWTTSILTYLGAWGTRLPKVGAGLGIGYRQKI